MPSDRTVLVLYGSETGNAQDLAEELGRLCQRLRFESRVQELNAVDLADLVDHDLVAFVISTAGQGDLPRNALAFWRRLLRKKLPHGCLSQLSFTCFGLGDSTYVNFNWAARKLVRRLEQLGASTFMEPCEADEQFPEGIDGSFVRWADELRSHLVKHHPSPHGLPPIPDDENLPARWSLEPALRAGEDTTVELSPLDLVTMPDAWTATLVDSKRMTPDTHWQDVRLLSFDVPHLECNPGDCLTIYPKNSPDDVNSIMTLMGWESVADQPLDLSVCNPLPRDLHAPSPCSLRGLLIHSIDIAAVPRRSFLRAISYYASDPDQRDRLLELTTTDFLDDYFDYATRSRRSILEVLSDFDSVRVPADRLIDVFPLIRGRDFSIANAGSSPIQLLVAMVRYRTILRKPREGLCSRYLTRLHPGSLLNMGHRPAPTPIHGPRSSSRPLIAMATGTGIAPIRSLILQRLQHPAPPPTILFFGNRNRTKDFFFADEWPPLIRRGILTLHTAFSRDQPQKTYIQHLIRRQAPLLTSLSAQNPMFLVCGGSSKMADACRSALLDVLVGEDADDDVRRRKMGELDWWQEIW